MRVYSEDSAVAHLIKLSVGAVIFLAYIVRDHKKRRLCVILFKDFIRFVVRLFISVIKGYNNRLFCRVGKRHLLREQKRIAVIVKILYLLFKIRFAYKHIWVRSRRIIDYVIHKNRKLAKASVAVFASFAVILSAHGKAYIISCHTNGYN